MGPGWRHPGPFFVSGAEPDRATDNNGVSPGNRDSPNNRDAERVNA